MLMNGRHLSFADIVRMYQQPLYWYIRRVTIVHEDAEDILQETFMKAYKHLWQLRNQGALKPWLMRIATNELNRYFKRRPVVSSMEELPDHTWAFVPESPGTDVPKAASGLISAALLKMSPLQRQVFSLRYYEELDYDEISRITGSNKNTLMVSYYEARKKIEKEIENG
ncbi:MAG: RNA polymerase sigma factor [Bacteroidales bacterium]|nr:RNA polymerase sigma factor [Bacteroidales bacterium]